MRNTFLDKRESKNSILKKYILSLCIEQGEYSISELSKNLNTSVPTVTKLIQELIDEGFMIDLGKQGTSGGRRPSIFGLNPGAGYFIGVDIRHSHASIAVADFKGNIISFTDNIPFVLESKEESIKRISVAVRTYFDEHGLDFQKALGLGVSITGRINPETGESNTYQLPGGMTIGGILEESLDIPVLIENDSRAMTYGEFLAGAAKKDKNFLFVNISWGLGMGMILDGRLFYGKSGFSGEIGHFPLLDNDVICRCGKVGCFETGASGSALNRMVLNELKNGRSSSLSSKFHRGEKITINDIYEAVKEEDVLAIEKVQEVGTVLGRGIAGLINVFNPDLVVIGGKMAVAGDYLMLPVRSSVKKYAQNFVAKDTYIRFSKLGTEAAPVGAALLSRSRLLKVDF
ncbi:MAG: ROK family transcriptional regulator [Bacteroidales bacterium]|jgi:predicted NBD/HSP70 family sugar kinase/predicted transcriptional regulator|nr:ROK family transcriptional regulator [Bacteroidales bacterium]MBQ2549696.1 ROK family transcriptional regulator [Bacteroidales bacterium]MBQ3846237.1 ROK family transcriptional regulator [Bacteroidales bacterium]